MNNYGFEYGFHTPKSTKKYIETINDNCPLKFEDTSWHNDLCDSCTYEIDYDKGEFIQIMLPNSDRNIPQNEEFNTFCIMDGNQDNLLVTEDILEVIEFIRKHDKSIILEEIKSNVDVQLCFIYGDIAETFNLESGDVSPNEMEELESISNQLAELLFKYVQNNK